MAEKNQEDKDEEQPELTPEQRIEKLEKSKTLSLILIILLSVLSLASTAGVGYLLSIPADERPARHATQLEDIRARLIEMQRTLDESTGLNLQSQLLQAKTEQVLAQADINNFARLRELMVQQEQSFSNFINALQQGMYELARMVRGSRTWYEVYKEELDKVLAESEERMIQLEGMKRVRPKKAEP